MERWVAYALASMAFAGVTSVIAKVGLEGISSELGLAIRTTFVFCFVLAFGLLVVPRSELQTVGPRNLGWLAISAATTAASWVFYYKALKLGQVSTVALIDKGSILIAIVLAWMFLKEQITARVIVGAALMLTGLILVARR